MHRFDDFSSLLLGLYCAYTAYTSLLSAYSFRFQAMALHL